MWNPIATWYFQMMPNLRNHWYIPAEHSLINQTVSQTGEYLFLITAKQYLEAKFLVFVFLSHENILL